MRRANCSILDVGTVRTRWRYFFFSTTFIGNTVVLNLKKKTVIAENQCEKHKKSSF